MVWGVWGGVGEPGGRPDGIGPRRPAQAREPAGPSAQQSDRAIPLPESGGTPNNTDSLPAQRARLKTPPHAASGQASDRLAGTLPEPCPPRGRDPGKIDMPDLPV